jgi:8-oxoguanine deaminase
LRGWPVGDHRVSLAAPGGATGCYRETASMALWIREPLAVAAEGADGGIVVDGGIIVECVPAGAAPRTPCDAEFDASAHVILPGLINTHHHFYQTLTRAVPAALNRELFDWLKALYPIWARLDEESFRLANRVAMAEMLLSGCTTTADHHYVFPVGLEGAIDMQAEEAAALGMRAIFTRGSMNLSVADGGLPPLSVVQDHDAIMADSERVIAAWHDPAPGAMLQIALAPCSPFSVTRELMRDTAALARRHDVRLHTHLAETEDEADYCIAHFGCRPLDYLEQCGWLDQRVWLAHGIHFEPDEIVRLGAHGIGVSHCAHSNMVLSSGMCPVSEHEAAGVRVGLGIDGSSSQDSSNMIQELRQAFLLNRLRSGTSVTHRDAIRWATEGSAACLGRDDIGRIAPGYASDLALFKLDELRFSGHGDPLAALIICGAHRADRVMVAGRWVVVDGAIPGLDIAALQHAHQAAARRIQAA